MSSSLTENGKRVQMINELQQLAAHVLKLKKDHTQRRTIVIEFGGSPKSGKTSCINSLELFLKRNGFSVDVIHERAGVCQVADKHSPMFNLWTSCMSISGMIDTLEKKEITCDVLILDRGIFDACCWFNWLAEKKFMEKEQKEIVERFLLMKEFVDRIDIVFAFFAKPEISINREYTHLLTDKLGSIMNEKVLSEYYHQIENVIKEKKNYFHNIIPIETSVIDQNEVGKIVTEKTLETLQDLLMERIGYFHKSSIEEKLHHERVFRYSELSEKLGTLCFGFRSDVEDNKHYIQPIPIAVITNREHNKILTVKKNPVNISDISPERDKLLIYVGGHIRYEDNPNMQLNDLIEVYKRTLRREVREEIGISIQLDGIEPFFIYTPNSDRDKVHIGVCFLLEMDLETIKLRFDKNELLSNKGTSQSGKFQEIDKILKKSQDMESWSNEILLHCFKKQTMPLFENSFDAFTQG
jgi:predicted NUDIX family phosphoesterase